MLTHMTNEELCSTICNSGSCNESTLWELIQRAGLLNEHSVCAYDIWDLAYSAANALGVELIQ